MSPLLTYNCKSILLIPTSLVLSLSNVLLLQRKTTILSTFKYLWETFHMGCIDFKVASEDQLFYSNISEISSNIPCTWKYKIQWKIHFTNRHEPSCEIFSLLGQVVHAQCRTNKTLSVSNCCQENVVQIMASALCACTNCTSSMD